MEEYNHAQLKTYIQIASIHSKSERFVLALKIGPFRWVKYSPIFGSNLAPLNQGQYSPISYGWFGPRAEMGPTVGWNSLLIELFWPKLCSKGSRKGWIRLWPTGLNWHFHFRAETDLFNFQCIIVYTSGKFDVECLTGRKNELLLRHILSVINVPCVINIKCALRERKKVNSLQSKTCEQKTLKTHIHKAYFSIVYTQLNK